MRTLMRVFFQSVLGLCVILLQGGALRADAGTMVSAPEPLYRFAPVFEGARLSHTFILQNRGKVPVRIRGVAPS